jgi:excisionase family DNA binding protein
MMRIIPPWNLVPLTLERPFYKMNLHQTTQNRRLDMMEPLMTPEEVMAELNVSRWVLYGLVNAGKIRAIRIGKLYRFERSDVVEYRRQERQKDAGSEGRRRA